MRKGSDAVAGEAPSFETFLERERTPLLGFLRRRMPTEEDAQDVAQECLMRMLRYARSEPPRAWKPLLYRVAANAACDHARRRAARHSDEHVPLDHEELISDTLGPHQSLVRDEELEILEQAILELTPKCRQVFLLHRMEGMTYSEIAGHMGFSESMVQKYISRALGSLAEVAESYAAASKES